MIFGVYISTKKIAIASLYGGVPHIVELGPYSSKARWDERLELLYWDFLRFVQEKIVTDPTNCVFIEEIHYVQNYQTLIKLVHVLAMCRIVLVHHGVRCVYVNNKTWKKGLGVKGGKDAYRKKAIQLFGDNVNSLSQDAIDALLIAQWGA